MINHVRTLLLNQPGGLTYADTFPGEEIVAAAYLPPPLPATLSNAWQTLMGSSNPDRALVNLRLQQLLGFVHADPALDPLSRARDARISYYPFRSDRLFRAQAFGATLTQTGGNATSAQLIGNLGQFISTGPIYYHWTVTITGAGSYKIDTVNPVPATSTGAYTSSGGISSPIVLPYSNLSLTFAAPVVPVYPIWDVIGLARPAYGLEGVYEAVAALQPVPAALFGPDDSLRQSLLDLWNSSAGWPYRLGAWTLALAYSLDDLQSTAG